MSIMKTSYRNKAAAPAAPRPILGLVSLGIAVIALVIAVIALVRPPHEHDHRHEHAPTPPLEASRDLPATDPADPGQSVDRPRAAAPPDSASPASAPAATDLELARADKPYVAPAGRSPIPQPGESIERPLPPAQLQAPPTGTAPKPDTVVSWDKAANHLGYDVTVEGRIVDTHLIDSGAICFLNFKQNDREAFYLAMFEAAFADLPQPPQDYYLGKTIRVTGLVKTHRGRPQIEVHSLDQIKVVDGS